MHQQKEHLVSLNYKDPLDIAEADVPSLDRQEQQQLLEQNDVGEIEDTSVAATASSTSAGAATAVSSPQQQQQQMRRSKSCLSPNLKKDGFALYPHLFIPESKKTNPVQTWALEPVISTASSPTAATAKQQTNKSSLRRLLQPFTWLSSIVTSSKRIHNTDSSVGSTSQHQKQRRRRRRRQRQHRDRILLLVPTILQRIKHTIQSRLEGRTVYVLALTNNKYYVGSTSNRKRRYKQHATNRGAKYTRIHGPIQYIYAEYRHVPKQYILGYESYITAQLMYQYGINNVRGGMFCGVQNLDMKNVDTLTYYIGHYCDLDYTHVYNSICHELESTSSSSVSMNKNVVKDSVNDGEEILSSMVSAISTMPSSSSSFATRSSRKRFRGSHESSLTPPSGNTKKRKKEHGSSSRNSSNNNNNSGGKVNNNARCYICGEIGHNAASCSMRHASSL